MWVYLYWPLCGQYHIGKAVYVWNSSDPGQVAPTLGVNVDGLDSWYIMNKNGRWKTKGKLLKHWWVTYLLDREKKGEILIQTAQLSNVHAKNRW